MDLVMQDEADDRIVSALKSQVKNLEARAGKTALKQLHNQCHYAFPEMRADFGASPIPSFGGGQKSKGMQ